MQETDGLRKLPKNSKLHSLGSFALRKTISTLLGFYLKLGALAKSLQEGRVVPLLLDVDFKDISGPLAQFQAKKVEKSGLLDIVESINKLAETKIPDARLEPLFSTLWPSFEENTSKIPKGSALAKNNRPQSEVLEELVTSVRGLDLRLRESIEMEPRLRKRRPIVHPMMIEELSRHLNLGRNDPTRFLLLGSMLKDDFPWLFELGLEAYRQSRGNPSTYREARRRFITACQLVLRGPYLEMTGGKETHYMLRELISTLDLADPNGSENTEVRDLDKSPGDKSS